MGIERLSQLREGSGPVAVRRGGRHACSTAVRRTGFALAARIGSTVASAALATSALTSGALTGTAGRSTEHAAVLHRRSLLAGGPLHTAAFGLLTGVLGIASWRSPQVATTTGCRGLWICRRGPAVPPPI